MLWLIQVTMKYTIYIRSDNYDLKEKNYD